MNPTFLRFQDTDRVLLSYREFGSPGRREWYCYSKGYDSEADRRKIKCTITCTMDNLKNIYTIFSHFTFLIIRFPFLAEMKSCD